MAVGRQPTFIHCRLLRRPASAFQPTGQGGNKVGVLVVLGLLVVVVVVVVVAAAVVVVAAAALPSAYRA